ncbi:MAG: 2-C-methyl-D-erythritol 4-phosphate cytidylyltransferase [Lachnospiraceae bacterium]|nr:2-C-methyl-D-erythritol 4-phosphate cytidylyltransferase [Lachnospiraceae bacterium]
MIYGAILAGGVGSRVKSASIPKQFIELDGKPVIAYTIENMLKVPRFDAIYIAVHGEWMEYMQRLVSDHFSAEQARIRLTYGGKERLDSIRNVTDAICRENALGEQDVIVIHDAARPFVTEKILNDSIDCAMAHGAVVAALPASDTILHSLNGQEVSEIPDRKMVYHGQAPDSFNLKLFLDMQAAIPEEKKAEITGTSQICTLNGVTLHMVEGDSINFKITTDSDLVMAENIIRNR